MTIATVITLIALQSSQVAHLTDAEKELFSLLQQRNLKKLEQHLQTKKDAIDFIKPVWKGQTALHMIAEGKNLSLCSLLIQYGADPLHQDHFGENALDHTLHNNSFKLFKYLCSHGVCPDQETLTRAIEKRRCRMCRFLYKQGIKNPKLKNRKDARWYKHITKKFRKPTSSQ